MKPRSSTSRPAAPGHDGAPRLRRPNHLVHFERGPAGDLDGVATDSGYSRPAVDVHATFGQNSPKLGSGVPVVCWENVVGGTEEMELRLILTSGPVSLSEQRPQGMLNRQRQLDTGSPGADDADPKSARLQVNPCLELFPAIDQSGDRLDRHGMLGSPDDRVGRCHADVD